MHIYWKVLRQIQAREKMSMLRFISLPFIYRLSYEVVIGIHFSK